MYVGHRDMRTCLSVEGVSKCIRVRFGGECVSCEQVSVCGSECMDVTCVYGREYM